MSFEKFSATVVSSIFVFGMLAVVAVVFGWVTMFTWNETMPYLFGLKTITYYHGIMLNLLSGMLLKSSSSPSSK